jgi:hypothetical protein
VDGLALLVEARAAGLRVDVEGDRLRIRGPRTAAPVAEHLVQNKEAVMVALSEVTRDAQVQADARTPPSLDAYLALLATPDAVAGPELPPQPPWPPNEFSPPERGVAWAAWWDAVERQRALGNVGEARPTSVAP